jgi:hypothetical protein
MWEREIPGSDESGKRKWLITYRKRIIGDGSVSISIGKDNAVALNVHKGDLSFYAGYFPPEKPVVGSYTGNNPEENDEEHAWLFEIVDDLNQQGISPKDTPLLNDAIRRVRATINEAYAM